MRGRTFALLAGATLVGSVVVGAPSAASAAPALRVSNNPSSCAGTYSTIQSAIDASGPKATIVVCPGVYNEQIQISGPTHDGLTLKSLKSQQATIKWPIVEVAPLALVDVNGANKVAVRDFVVSGPFTFGGCSADRHEGVLVEGGASLELRGNHITQIKNSVPALYGCQEGDAVAVGRRTLGSTPGTATVSGNRIDEYQKNGVQVVNAGSSATIDNNVVRGSTDTQSTIASNGIVVFNGATSTITGNVVSNNKFTPSPMSTGISYAQAPSTVSGNLVYDNDIGIEVDTATGGRISSNTVRTSVSDGIQLCGNSGAGCGAVLTNVEVSHNSVTNNQGNGINLIATQNDKIDGNQVSSNGSGTGDATDGIRVDADSTQNHLNANSANSNVTHDCYDASTGLGTAGTANFWTNNQGATQNKPGLCDAHNGHRDDAHNGHRDDAHNGRRN